MSGFKIDMMQSILGGGKQGAQPMGGLLGGGAGPTGGSGMVGSSARSRNRTVLRKAFWQFSIVIKYDESCMFY